MKKRILIAIIFFFALLVLVASMLTVYQKSSPNHEFVIFANYQNVDEFLRGKLVARLEDNQIEYRVDEHGNVKIKNKDVKRAVRCCS